VIGYTVVYRNVRTGKVFVQPYAKSPRGKVAYGVVLPVNADELGRIGNYIEQALSRFKMTRYHPQEAVRHSREQQKEFICSHVAVSVTEQESGDLLLHPLHHEMGGFVGRDDDTIRVLNAERPTKLAEAVQEALMRAT
jgi:hypothetical protein